MPHIIKEKAQLSNCEIAEQTKQLKRLYVVEKYYFVENQRKIIVIKPLRKRKSPLITLQHAWQEECNNTLAHTRPSISNTSEYQLIAR